MTEYMPTTPVVRESYVDLMHRWVGAECVSEREARAEFDRWLEKVQAEAWDEGFDAGERDALDLDTHPDHTCTPNPYREERTDECDG